MGLYMNLIIPDGAVGQNNIENLQLLCARCNRVKDDRPREYLVARLRPLRITTLGDPVSSAAISIN